MIVQFNKPGNPYWFEDLTLEFQGSKVIVLEGNLRPEDLKEVAKRVLNNQQCGIGKQVEKNIKKKVKDLEAELLRLKQLLAISKGLKL